ncbi:unnamed protein product [Mycena citricolor]|uniref:Uncharacterized protein n=1 Tax=Mycena citricolor TaxID=2018698 RepID=A0AAD2JV59_9AGAR|nr:unnamed protein product [Mycena citricolor]
MREHHIRQVRTLVVAGVDILKQPTSRSNTESSVHKMHRALSTSGATLCYDASSRFVRFCQVTPAERFQVLRL